MDLDVHFNVAQMLSLTRRSQVCQGMCTPSIMLLLVGVLSAIIQNCSLGRFRTRVHNVCVL